MTDTNNVQGLTNTTQAMYTLFAKFTELLGLVSQSPSLGDHEALQMCLDEWIERYKDQLANPTTPQESCTQRFEDSQEDAYDSDATTMGDNASPRPTLTLVVPPRQLSRPSPSSQSESPMSPSFIPLQKRQRCE